MNKKGIAISVILLVITTLLLVGVCVGYFIFSDRIKSISLQTINEIDSAYVQENYLNFYLQEIFDNSAKDFKSTYGKDYFINSYKNELLKYKDEKGAWIMPEFSQVDLQINESNINMHEGKISLTLNLAVRGNSESIEVIHKYEKTFEKVFKGKSIN